MPTPTTPLPQPLIVLFKERRNCPITAVKAGHWWDSFVELPHVKVFLCGTREELCKPTATPGLLQKSQFFLMLPTQVPHPCLLRETVVLQTECPGTVAAPGL